MPTNFILKGAALSLAALIVASPAGAVITTFATYTADSTADNLRWQQQGTSGGSLYTINGASNLPSPVGVKFNFLSPELAGFGALDAAYTLTAAVPVGNPAGAGGGSIVQPALSGGFSFRYAGTSPIVVGGTTYTTGANLLTATFTNAAIAGTIGASSGSVSASSTSTPPATITYTSDLLDFSDVVSTGFAINLTSIRPSLGQAGPSSSLNSFRTSSGGSFAAEPAPVTAIVPEPATWAMMTFGFGLVGFGLRRRNRPVAAHA